MESIIDKQYYKKFAQKYLSFNIDEYEYKIFKKENKIELYIYICLKRDKEIFIKFIFNDKNCTYENDGYEEDLSYEWQNYIKNQEKCK